MLRVKTKDFEFLRFISYEIESSIDTVADGFSFVIGNAQGINAGRLIPGEPVEIFNDDARLMLGEIDTVEEADTIVVKGRDLMVRAIENDVEHKEGEENIQPAKEIKRLAKSVGINKFDTSGLPGGIKPIEAFTQEAGESVAEVMVRLAEAGAFNIWLDRFGVLHMTKLDFRQPPGWNFFNESATANCNIIKRRQSAANLKSELWAFTEISEDDQIVKHNNQALIRAGLNRRKTILDPESDNREIAHAKLVKLMDELNQRGKEWDISYGGPHSRETAVPEPGRTALITSIFSGVVGLKALIVSVVLKLDDNGTNTALTLREAA